MVTEEPTNALKEALSWEDSFNVVLAIVETASAKEDPDLLSKYEIFAIHTNLLDSEVYNGGFQQFFRNKSGNYSLEILSSLQEIGSKHIASLLEVAISLFLDFNDLREQNHRFEFIQNMRAEELRIWQELSQAYYRSSESIYDMVVSYIRKTYNL